MNKTAIVDFRTNDLYLSDLFIFIPLLALLIHNDLENMCKPTVHSVRESKEKSCLLVVKRRSIVVGL